MLISVAEFAKRREISPQAVRKAISSGRLKACVVRKGNSYQLDSETADREWEANTMQARSNPASVINAGKAAAKGMGGGLQFDPSMGKNYSQFRAYGEGFKAKLLELEYREKAGQLTRTDEVKAATFKTFRLVRDAMQNIPIRVVNEMAAVIGDVDPEKRHEMLLIMQREIDKAFNATADRDGLS